MIPGVWFGFTEPGNVVIYRVDGRLCGQPVRNVGRRKMDLFRLSRVVYREHGRYRAILLAVMVVEKSHLLEEARTSFCKLREQRDRIVVQFQFVAVPAQPPAEAVDGVSGKQVRERNLNVTPKQINVQDSEESFPRGFQRRGVSRLETHFTGAMNREPIAKGLIFFDGLERLREVVEQISASLLAQAVEGIGNMIHDGVWVLLESNQFRAELFLFDSALTQPPAEIGVSVISGCPGVSSCHVSSALQQELVEEDRLWCLWMSSPTHQESTKSVRIGHRVRRGYPAAQRPLHDIPDDDQGQADVIGECLEAVIPAAAVGIAVCKQKAGVK
ncbi:MAG: hypothetical protein JW395_2192 [Nitrospira sp.]|nr:hypothetical protein [Nitrospira sp.]